MTIDDEAIGWKAHEALERGVDPVLPETSAARRIGQLLAKYLPTPYLTADFFAAVGGKAVANRDALRRIFDEVDQDPRKLGDGGTVLRRQQTARFDDQDGILEELAEINARRDLLHDWLTQMRSPYAPPPKLRDADDRAADEDDLRISRERADEKAAANAPRVAS